MFENPGNRSLGEGQVLDTARIFQGNLSMPLMRNKNQTFGLPRRGVFSF